MAMMVNYDGLTVHDISYNCVRILLRFPLRKQSLTMNV